LLDVKTGYALNESIPHGSDIAVHTVLFKSKCFHYPEKLAKHSSIVKKKGQHTDKRKREKKKKKY